MADRHDRAEGWVQRRAGRVFEDLRRIDPAHASRECRGQPCEGRLLAASNSPDLWASDVSITAGLRVPRPGLGVYGEFDTYLFDSKFHVPRDGRHVFIMGIRKAFGQT